VVHQAGLPAGQGGYDLRHTDRIGPSHQREHRHSYDRDSERGADDDQAPLEPHGYPPAPYHYHTPSEIHPAYSRRLTRRREASGRIEAPVRGHSPLAFRRRTRTINTGAPTKAVTMPTGISLGCMTIRPRISEASKRLGASSTL